MTSQQVRRVAYMDGSRHVFTCVVAVALVLSGFVTRGAHADVPSGTREKAIKYYGSLSKVLEYSTPESIVDTTLDDVASYLGYSGLTGTDLQDLPSPKLMSPRLLLAPPEASGPSDQLKNREAFIASLGAIPLRPEDILASRFFAPKIVNVNIEPSLRPLGWRKLVRLRAREGSRARAHGIASGVILFNFFSQPGTIPFANGSESVNTQVMLIPDPSANDRQGADALYWLDFEPLSKGGKLSLALDASFDANELHDAKGGVRSYFVPDGCVACHGEHPEKSLVNYLDTDHWFDRLDTDFVDLKQQGTAILFDAESNDPSTEKFKKAFDAIRRFNEEAEEQVHAAQPSHFEAAAARKWLVLHQASNEHVPPVDRGFGKPAWDPSQPNDVEAIGLLNQYCFRCHGTIKFSVFDKSEIRSKRALLRARLKPNAEQSKHSGFLMPPDRALDERIRDRILEILPRGSQ